MKKQMGFKGWDKVIIKTKEGNEIEGIVPIIISASRSTDIPAFYSEWLMKRINAGYVKWINPFNRQSQYISFEKARVFVFWTKNAKPLIQYLPSFDKLGINYYFTFTLNDYEDEGLEPNVPILKDRIETFKQLSEIIGKEKIIWRFDPLIISDRLTVGALLDKIDKVGNELHNFTEKLVISFADIMTYKKVKQNLSSAKLGDFREFAKDEMIQIAEEIQRLNSKWNLEIASCCEEIDLSEFGIKHNKCIDDELMAKLFSKDQVLMDFLGYKEGEQAFLAFANISDKQKNGLKDKGQRKVCGCIASKDIGQYNTCKHLCAYCYANHSRKLVEDNYLKYQQDGNELESILGG
jgi:DNA repair photolyase